MKFIKHVNTWIWGKSTIIITNDGYGTITVQTYDDEPNRAYIVSLSVEQTKRKNRYATRLVEEAEKEAANYGVKTISLSVDKNSWVYNCLPQDILGFFPLCYYLTLF